MLPDVLIIHTHKKERGQCSHFIKDSETNAGQWKKTFPKGKSDRLFTVFVNENVIS